MQPRLQASRIKKVLSNRLQLVSECRFQVTGMKDKKSSLTALAATSELYADVNFILDQCRTAAIYLFATPLWIESEK